MIERQVQSGVLEMTLRKPWRFFRHTEGGSTEVKKGPGKFEVMRKGQRLVFVDDPETGMDEAYVHCWSGGQCGEYQITIIDSEKEKAKREVEERAQKEAEEKLHRDQETERKEEVLKEETPVVFEESRPSQALKKEIEREATQKKKEKTDVLSEEELSRIGKVVDEKK